MKTATLVEAFERKGNSGDRFVSPGDKAVYRLSEPLSSSYVNDGAPFSHVYVSTASVMGTPETYAFASDEKGEVLCWTELDGSQKGNASHAQVLEDMGYKLVSTDSGSAEPDK